MSVQFLDGPVLVDRRPPPTGEFILVRRLTSSDGVLVHIGKWRIQRGKLRIASDGFACDQRQLPRVIAALKKAQGVAK